MQVTGSKILVNIAKCGISLWIENLVRNMKNTITEVRPFQTTVEIFVWQGYKDSVPGHHSPPGF